MPEPRALLPSLLRGQSKPCHPFWFVDILDAYHEIVRVPTAILASSRHPPLPSDWQIREYSSPNLVHAITEADRRLDDIFAEPRSSFERVKDLYLKALELAPQDSQSFGLASGVSGVIIFRYGSRKAFSASDLLAGFRGHLSVLAPLVSGASQQGR